MTRWYEDAAARRFIVLRYLPWLAALSLAWEIAHLPLYSLWYESASGDIALSVAHCTAGDVVIGLASFLVVLTLAQEAGMVHWRRRRIAFGTSALSTAYTIFSEWMNIAILGSWAYAPTMPTLDVAGFELGLSPLAQWLVVPSLALYLPGHMGTPGPGRTRSTIKAQSCDVDPPTEV